MTARAAPIGAAAIADKADRLEQLGDVAGGMTVPLPLRCVARSTDHVSPVGARGQVGARRGAMASRRGGGSVDGSIRSHRRATAEAPNATITERSLTMAAKPRKSSDDAESQRLNCRISPDAYRRLGVHAVMKGISPGTLIEKLIDEHLKEYRVQAVRSASVVSDDRLDAAVSVNPLPHLAL